MTRRHECLGVCFHHSVAGFDEMIALMAEPTSHVSHHWLIAAGGLRGTRRFAGP